MEKGRYFKNRHFKEELGKYDDEKVALFADLARESDTSLLGLLERAYQSMTPPQRRDVFGDRLDQIRAVVFDGQYLLHEIEKFRDESLRGAFYAPFAIDSRNYTHIPAETREWFDRLGDFLKAATALVNKGDYQNAVAAFDTLYELIDTMESGEEIVFADECGSWMIPVREDECVAAYLKAVAQVENEVGFANAAVEMLRRDKSQSFTLNAYPSALSCGNPGQITAFEAKIRRLGLSTK